METVIDTSDAPRSLVPGDPGQGANPKPETVTITKTELDALNRRVGEAEHDAKYWAGVARTGNGNGHQAEPAGEVEEGLNLEEFTDPDAPTGIVDGDTPEKLVDELASKGVEALRSRGFVSAADAERIAVQAAEKVARTIVGAERQKLVTDNQLMSEFPDLRNPQSELFKETAIIYRQAVAMDPAAKKTPAALFLAAKAASTAIRARGGHADENEQDRLDRIAGQDGRTRTGRQAEDDDALGDQAKSIISQMGVSEDEFKKYRNEQRAESPRGRRR